MLMSKGRSDFLANRLVTSLVVAAMALLLLPLVLQIVRLLRRPGQAAQEQAAQEKVRSYEHSRPQQKPVSHWRWEPAGSAELTAK